MLLEDSGFDSWCVEAFAPTVLQCSPTYSQWVVTLCTDHLARAPALQPRLTCLCNHNRRLMHTIGSDMDLETGASSAAARALAAGPSPAGGDPPAHSQPPAAAPRPDPNLAAAAAAAPPADSTNSGGGSGSGGGAMAGGARSLSTADRLVRVPEGHALVQVSPGLYELRQTASGADAAAAMSAGCADTDRREPHQAALAAASAAAASAAFASESSASPDARRSVLRVPLPVSAGGGAGQQLVGMQDAVLSQAQAQLRLGSLAAALFAPPPDHQPAPQDASFASGLARLGPAAAAAAAAAGVTSLGGAPAARPAPAADGRRRASSQRFRERQKELITELENEVVHRLEQVELLSRENDVLKFRSHVLERAVEGQEEQVGVGGVGCFCVLRGGSGVREPTLLHRTNAPQPTNLPTTNQQTHHPFNPTHHPFNQIQIIQDYGVRWPSGLKSNQIATASDATADADVVATAAAGSRPQLTGDTADAAASTSAAAPAAATGGGGGGGQGIEGSPLKPDGAGVGAAAAPAAEPSRPGGGGGTSWLGERPPTVQEIKALTPEGTKLVWRAFLHLASRELIALQEEEAAGAAVSAAAAATAVPADSGAPAAAGGGAAGAAEGGVHVSPFAGATAAASRQPSESAGGSQPDGACGGSGTAGGGGTGGGSTTSTAGGDAISRDASVDQPRPYFGARRPLPAGVPPGSAVARLHAVVSLLGWR
jgi:hypothetical protein